jgi:hypothetical protein
MQIDQASCYMSQIFNSTTQSAKYFTYTILVYPYFILGIFGHFFLLLACIKQTKQEAAYLYQLFLAVCRILEIMSFTILSLAFNRWAGLDNEGASWYRSRHWLMWFAAHLNIPLVNGLINTCLFLSVFMSTDRLFALAAPFAYRRISNKRNKLFIFIFCLLLGFLIVAFDLFRFKINFDQENKLYTLTSNDAYIKSKLATILANIRNGILIFAVLCLIVCNIANIILYRKKVIDGMKTHAVNNAVANETKESIQKQERSRKRKEIEKALILLTICQSILNALSISFLASFFVLAYLAPEFVNCKGLLMAPILDASLQISTLLDFYLPLLISKKFRLMIFSWCMKRRKHHQEAGPGRAGAIENLHI